MSSGEENRQVVRETFFSLKVVISWLQRVYSRRSEAKWVMRFEIKNWKLSILLNNARKIDPLLKLIDELQLQKHTLAMQFCSFAVLGVVSLRFNSKPLIYYSDIFVKVSCSFFCLVPPKGSLEIAFELKYIRKFSAYRILAHGLQLFPAWASVIVFKILSPETKKKRISKQWAEKCGISVHLRLAFVKKNTLRTAGEVVRFRWYGYLFGLEVYKRVGILHV